eukprot:Skav216816  [mRNA]  locus=scaffold135:165915:166811:- [translate_table: standard]
MVLVQAFFAVRWLSEGQHFGTLTFAEAAFTALAPFISDGFDTVKDTIFSALCWRSQFVVLNVIGVLSWLYLLAIHVYFIWNNNTLAELVGCYLPALTALPEYHPSDSSDSSDSSNSSDAAKNDGDSGQSCFDCQSCWEKIWEKSCFDCQPCWEKIWEKVMSLLYKQFTPTKREMLLIENLPQAIFSCVFLALEDGSNWFVWVTNGIPLVQIWASYTFFDVVLQEVGPQLGRKLSTCLQKPDYFKAKQLWHEAGLWGSLSSFSGWPLGWPAGSACARAKLGLASGARKHLRLLSFCHLQ